MVVVTKKKRKHVEIRKSLWLKKAMFLKIFVRKWLNWKVVLII